MRILDHPLFHHHIHLSIDNGPLSHILGVVGHIAQGGSRGRHPDSLGMKGLSVLTRLRAL